MYTDFSNGQYKICEDGMYCQKYPDYLTTYLDDLPKSTKTFGILLKKPLLCIRSPWTIIYESFSGLMHIWSARPANLGLVNGVKKLPRFGPLWPHF